ncbi:MAG: hypothetical protein IJ165_00665 [Proteobacteria bacterium]|nr:hypothetical protein [Pseudomonadota bacterium]
MKDYIFAAMAATALLLAGCDSDTPDECKTDEVKADCNEGKYTKCVSGKWEEAVCENNASCAADGICGECTDGDIKADCSDGKVSKCVNGKWEQTTCENNASCKSDGTCGECTNDTRKDCENGESGIGQVTVCENGEWSATKQACAVNGTPVSCTPDGLCGDCLTGDSTKCANDSDHVGSAIFCKDGHWAEEIEMCPKQLSCAMTDECYQCHNQCDLAWDCPADCKDSSCESSCAKNAACKKECGECDSKCGECLNNSNRKCTEDGNGVGSAEICLNGTWTQKGCNALRIINVSCTRTCPTGISCEESEKEDFCGECKNTKANEYICIAPHDSIYGPPGLFGSYTQLFTCENGRLNSQMMCPANICDPQTGQCD